MANDAAGFRAELDQMVRAIEDQVLTFQRKVVLDLFMVVNMGNPVGNPTLWEKPRKGYVGGQSRRNWRLAFTRGGAQLPGTNPAPRGAVDTTAQGAAVQFLTALQEPQSLWLTNPMPYMDRLEAGWSSQAPSGWMLSALYGVAEKYNLRVI